jgi:GntR family transcriptional regulator
MRENDAVVPGDFHIDPSRPIYEQFVEQIRSRIASGRIPPGTRLPSVRDLAAEMRINPTTAARTYQELERLGLIVTHRGQGTFVTNEPDIIRQARKAMAQDAVSRLKEIAESIGLTVKELIEMSEENER